MHVCVCVCESIRKLKKINQKSGASFGCIIY
jgi:hypothetical protein